LGRKIKVTCKLCGNVLSRYSTINLWSHLVYKHNLRDFVIYDKVQATNVTCRFCKAVFEVQKPWQFDLHTHLKNWHTFAEFYEIEPYTHIEIMEFHCERCFHRKTSHHFTCWLDRDSYEKGWVLPVCQWCQHPMGLRRKKDKERYE